MDFICIVNRIIVCLVCLGLDVSADVSWELSSGSVIIGEAIILTCTVHNVKHIDRSITRQWSTGHDGQLLSFNGQRNKPLKYEEILLNGNQFSLKINNVAETDLKTVYECRYGFDIYSKKLEVDKSMIIDPPAKDTTDVSYTTDDSIVDLKITFRKVFAFPNCTVQYQKENVLYFELVAYSKNDSSSEGTAIVHLPCKDGDSICNKEYNIVCYINSTKYYIDGPVRIVKENSKLTILTSSSLACCLVILIAVFVSYVIYVNRYKNWNSVKETSCAVELEPVGLFK